MKMSIERIVFAIAGTFLLLSVVLSQLHSVYRLLPLGNRVKIAGKKAGNGAQIKKNRHK